MYQHNPTLVIGRPIKIWEQEDGAYADVEFSDFECVPLAKQVHSQLITGHINQMSFGYQYIGDKIERIDDDTWLIKELMFHEISAVTFGCNEETAFVESLKSMCIDPAAEKRIKQELSLSAEPTTKSLTEGVDVFAEIGRKL